MTMIDLLWTCKRGCQKKKLPNLRGFLPPELDELIADDGPIYPRRGVKEEVFTVVESSPKSDSAIFVTKGSAGFTSTDRIDLLELPSINKALYENLITLSRDQILLGGTIAPQPSWAVEAADGIKRSDGGW